MARLALAVLAILLICVTTQGDAAPSPLLGFFNFGRNNLADGQMSSTAAPILAQWNSGAAIANLVDFPTPEPNVFSDGLDVIKNVNQLSRGLFTFGPNKLADGQADVPMPVVSAYFQNLQPTFPEVLDTLHVHSLKGPADVEDLLEYLENSLVDVDTSVKNADPNSPSGDLTSGPNGDAGIQADVPMPVVSAYFQNLQPTFPEVLADVQNAVSGSLGGDPTSRQNGVAGIHVDFPTPEPNVFSDGLSGDPTSGQNGVANIHIAFPTTGVNVAADDQKLAETLP